MVDLLLPKDFLKKHQKIAKKMGSFNVLTSVLLILCSSVLTVFFDIKVFSSEYVLSPTYISFFGSYADACGYLMLTDQGSELYTYTPYICCLFWFPVFLVFILDKMINVTLSVFEGNKNVDIKELDAVLSDLKDTNEPFKMISVFEKDYIIRNLKDSVSELYPTYKEVVNRVHKVLKDPKKNDDEMVKILSKKKRYIFFSRFVLINVCYILTTFAVLKFLPPYQIIGEIAQYFLNGAEMDLSGVFTYEVKCRYESNEFQGGKLRSWTKNALEVILIREKSVLLAIVYAVIVFLLVITWILNCFKSAKVIFFLIIFNESQIEI